MLFRHCDCCISLPQGREGREVRGGYVGGGGGPRDGGQATDLRRAGLR